MGFEHLIILVVEVASAVGVFYTLFNWLFKNAFRDAVVSLNDSVNTLSSNVANQTKMLEKSLEQIEDIEKEVNGHETRIQLLEHGRKDK
jgi:hypothetical protein